LLLTLGSGLPHRLVKNQPHAYEIDLAAGIYLHATFEQRGVDLEIDVFAPGGHRKLFHIDSPHRDQGPEELRLVAEAAGRYRFEVSTTDDASLGTYVVQRRELHEATATDRAWAAADRAFYEARAIDAQPESFREAVAKYERSALLYQEVGDRWRQAYALFRLARVHYDHGRPQEARELFSRSERIFRDLKDLKFQCLALTEIGTCAKDLADFDAAAASYRSALALARQTGLLREQAVVLHNQGNLFQLQGFSWQALGAYREAQVLWQRQPGDAARKGEAKTLTGIGWVYFATGDWQRAIDAHTQALRMSNRFSKELGPRAVSLTQIGAAWLQIDPRRALPFLERARKLQQEQEAASAADRATTFNDLGLTFRRLERYREAQQAYRRALELYRSPPDLASQAVTWNNLGWISVYLNQPQEASKCFEQGLRLARQTHNPMTESRALLGMADAERERGNVNLAQLRAEESLRIVETLRSAVIRPDLQTSFLDDNENAYGLLIRILMERHRQQPGSGYDLQALSRSEQARARVLLDALRESHELRAALKADRSPERLTRRRQLLAEIGVADAQRRRPDATPSEVAATETRLSELLDRLSELDTQVRHRSLRSNSPEPPSVSVAEQARKLLDRDTILLEYRLGKPHSHLWAISSDAMQSFELPAREALEPLLLSVYSHFAGGGSGPADREPLELSRLLLGPVVHQLRGKRLLISATGLLQYIPFAALPDPSGSHEPLLLHHEISYVPSLAVLAELRGRAAARPPSPEPLALLADPVFDSSDERMAEGAALPLASDWKDVFLPRLPGSQTEATAIASLMPPGRAFQALGFEASRDLVTSGRLSRYRILHFATHGVQRTDRLELSALVLSRFDRQGSPRDGYLRASDIAALDLPADLVVLSACETALGRTSPGEGLVGLPQAFLIAGAQRVLVSLWKVEDESTAALMKDFYRRLLAEGEAPARALHEAQLAVRAQPQWHSPRYWAGFVLQGDCP
jgi:CHAT domain-containing protein/tetratricopeptide (TPR) repeat protein